MAIESGLAQQASMFTESLNVKPPPAVEKTADETGQEMKLPEQGDVVTISQEARALVAAEKPDDSSQAKEEKNEDQTIKLLKDRIETLEEEVKEVEDSNLPEKEKLEKIQPKQVQLMELREQLVKAEEAKLTDEGQASGGGTRANGFGKDAVDF